MLTGVVDKDAKKGSKGPMKVKLDIEKGDKVKIRDGTFANMEGEVKAISEAKDEPRRRRSRSWSRSSAGPSRSNSTTGRWTRSKDCRLMIGDWRLPVGPSGEAFINQQSEFIDHQSSCGTLDGFRKVVQSLTRVFMAP